jgi:hypothetical protein
VTSIERFRDIALAFAGTEEGDHMGHPDFRVRGKIFATLGAPDAEHGMVGLDPEQQAVAMAAEPEAFAPAAGAWGRRGSTLVRLERVSNEWLERTLRWAWELRVSKSLRR